MEHLQEGKGGTPELLRQTVVTATNCRCIASRDKTMAVEV